MSGSGKASPDVNFERALVPTVVRVNEKRVARGFWPKMRRVVAHVPFADQALAVWFCARDPETPFAARGMMMAALAYFVLPADAIPDIVPALGYTDDAAVFAALMALIGRNLKPRHQAAAKAAVARLRDGA